MSYARSSSLPVKFIVFSSPRALPSKDRVDADAGEGMCQEPSGQQSAGSAQLSGALPRPAAGIGQEWCCCVGLLEMGGEGAMTLA